MNTEASHRPDTKLCFDTDHFDGQSMSDGEVLQQHKWGYAFHFIELRKMQIEQNRSQSSSTELS